MSEDICRKMLFFDIDGTLITDDESRTFPESAKQAIRLARDNGHLVFINSGRVLVSIDDFIRAVDFDGYVCGCGTYISSQGKELLHHKLNREKCHEAVLKCRDYGMMSIFEHTEHIAYDKEVKGCYHRKILDYFKRMNCRIIDDIESPEFIFDKFTTWYEEKNPYVKDFVEYISRDFECIKREGNFFEIVPKGFSKATGIKFLTEYYNIPLANVFVFGDSNNDLEMLQYVPHSIAMGKCTPEVEAAASYKTDTVLADGIYNAMKHFGVIE